MADQALLAAAFSGITFGGGGPPGQRDSLSRGRPGGLPGPELVWRACEQTERLVFVSSQDHHSKLGRVFINRQPYADICRSTSVRGKVDIARTCQYVC